jgi:hypothetical protein
MTSRPLLLTLVLLATACGVPTLTVSGGNGNGDGGSGSGSGSGGGTATGGSGGGGAATGGGSATGGSGGGSSQSGCDGQDGGCYTVYAHSNHTLYSINLLTKALVVVGPFNAPNVGSSEDTMTDLAVAPDGVIWVVSHTAIYTADPGDGHVTRVGTLSDCGQDNVALTFTPDGTLYVADYKGAFCRIDYSVSPPVVTSLGALSGGWAISGDLVAVGDGTMYGSAYLLADAAGTGTQANNVIVKVDPATRAVTRLGASGYAKLFGVAYAQGKIFGFTHDGSGKVVTLDPHTGAGTLFNTFKDPGTNTPISFAGAGVNALVSPVIN